MARTDQVLKLLATLVEPPSGNGGRLEVVPVVMPDVDAHRALIEAAARDADGVFLDAESCSSGVEGTLDEDLLTTVTTALRVRRAGGTWTQPLLEQEAGAVVRGTIEGAGPEEALAAGDRTLLGIALSLFQRRLATTSFAMITYDETKLSGDRADVVWRLFTKILPARGLWSVRKLVVLIETPRPRYERHCAEGLSLAFRLGESGVERRKDRESNRVAILQLRPSGDRLVVLFLGAGFSASSGLPLGNKLRDEALARRFGSSESYPRLAARFRRQVTSDERLLSFERTMGANDFADTLTLERVLREELHDYGPENSPTLGDMLTQNDNALRNTGLAVRALHKLIRRRRHLVIVTVNFDTLIETSVEEHVKVYAHSDDFIELLDDLPMYRVHGGRVPVLKLHGTITDFRTIVATVDETARGLSVPKEDALRALVRQHDRMPWAWVGCSMRDPDVNRVLGQRQFGEGLDERWVTPFPMATVEEFVKQYRRFDGRRGYWERCITETADVFLAELADTWGL